MLSYNREYIQRYEFHCSVMPTLAYNCYHGPCIFDVVIHNGSEMLLSLWKYSHNNERQTSLWENMLIFTWQQTRFFWGDMRFHGYRVSIHITKASIVSVKPCSAHGFMTNHIFLAHFIAASQKVKVYPRQNWRSKLVFCLEEF